MQSTSEDFLHRLIERLPQSEPNLTTFPSGAFMIDLTINGEALVMEYLPSVGLGVSRLKTAVFGWEGFENEFATLDEVEAYLIKLSSLT